MSGIARRTVFINTIPVIAGEKKGPVVHVLLDRAIAHTTVGCMVEPFIFNDWRGLLGGAPAADADPKDMMRRVDEIRMMTNEAMFNAEESTTLHRYDQGMQTGPY